MPAVPLFKFPLDIESRTHFDITAFRYTLPTNTSIRQEGLVITNQSTGQQSENAAASGNASLGTEEVAVDVSRQDEIFRIKTYIPGGYGDKVSSNWADENVAFIGDPASISLGGAAQVKTLSDFTKILPTSIGAAGIGALRQMVGGVVESITSSGKLGSLRRTAEAAFGISIAPNIAKVFKGAAGRSLPLNFTFAPKNADEGAQMISIITLFRRSGLAELQIPSTPNSGSTASTGNPDLDQAAALASGIGAAGMVQLYKYPPIFDIRIIKGPEQRIRSGTFFEFKSMALISFDVSYSSGLPEYTYFHDGVPTKATLELNFESVFPAFRIGGILQDPETG